ncbi:MAG: hypothetical protein MH472_12200 [Bacteroidia bacterium]|nr:hypothetical protein [Bacteroidia bacterium]
MFILFFALCFFIVQYFVYSTIKKANYRIETGVNKIMIGDSQIECAFNDSGFSSIRNFGQSATSFLYSYIKIKVLIEANENIDTIFLGFNIRSLEKEKERVWIYNEDILLGRKLYFPFFGNNELSLFMKNKSFYYASSLILKDYFKILPDLIKGNSLSSQFGSFRPSCRNELEKEMMLLLKKEKLLLTKNNISSTEKLYLDKIINLCKNKGVKLILISTPNFKKCNYFDCHNFDILKSSLASQIKFYDYSDISNEGIYFSDPIHLNNLGSRYFTHILKKEFNLK